MSRHLERVIAALSVVLMAFAVSGGIPDVTLAVSIGLTTLGALAVIRIATGIARTPEVRVGGRSRAHRESLTEFAAPRHPSTRGRRRSRAPSMDLAAA